MLVAQSVRRLIILLVLLRWPQGPIPSELGSLNCLGQIELVENLLTGE